MATSRNARRKAAKARLLAKQTRLAKAELGRQADERRAIVARNLANPRPKSERGDGVTGIGYPASCMANMASLSHRGYICRAAGGMPRRQALALKAKGSW